MDSFGVIFDMDGTLVDSYRAHYESWLEAARRRGLTMDAAAFARTFGKVSAEIIHELWGDRFGPEEMRAFDREKEKVYREGLEKRFPEMDGAGDLIAALHAAGFRLAIGSSGPQENVELVRRCLRHGRHISAIAHGGEVRQGKPDPEVFLLAARKLGLEPRRCAVIEDAPVGVEAGRRAGMAVIAITGTAPREQLAARAHRVIDSLRELDPAALRAVIDQSAAVSPPPVDESHRARKGA